MVQEAKLNFVQKLTDLLSASKNFVIVKIDRTNHQALEAMRKQLKKNKASFKVTKNTYLEKTVNKLAVSDELFKKIKSTFFPLKETSALLTLDTDWSKGLISFYQFIQKEKTLSFKFGLLDGQAYPESELSHIAQLPSRDQLMSNIIGSFKSPTSHLVYATKFNLTKFVYILKEKAKKTN